MDRKIHRKVFVFGAILCLVFLIHQYHARKNISSTAFSDADLDFKSGIYINLDGENGPFPFKCTTCALVGYSGDLRESSLGSEIDEFHSCIFRLGFSPTRKKANYVGSRTTVRIVDSFRFYPFLKKPKKLISNGYASEFWFLHDWKPGDITRFHYPALKEMEDKHDSQYFWLSRKTEMNMLESLRISTKKLSTVSSLWMATRIIRDAECHSLDVYGIPDPYICKRNLNVSTPSLYWDEFSDKLCVNGVDSSYKKNTLAPTPLFPSPLERKVFFNWAQKHIRQVRFSAPSWKD